MEKFTDKSVLLKEAKGYEILRDSEESSDAKLQRDAFCLVEVVHGTKQIDMSGGEDAVRFECRGIGLEEKLAQLSIGKGELLLVRLRRGRQAGKKNQIAEEQQQCNARGSHLGSDCDKDHDKQEKAKRASEETDTGGMKREDGDGRANKDCEWQHPKEKDGAIDFNKQQKDTERKEQNLKTKNVERKIQPQSNKEQLLVRKVRPKQKMKSDAQRRGGVNSELPKTFKKQRKEKQSACLRDQLKEKDDSIVEVKRELQKTKQDFATLETNFKEMETQLSDLQRQLLEKCIHETALGEQLATREEEAKTMEQQLRSEVEEKDTNIAVLQERLRVEEQRVTELQSQVGTNEEEIGTMRQQLNLSHRQLQERERDITTLQGRLRDEEQQSSELQRHFRENVQEIRMMRVQLTELRNKEQQLRVAETQRVIELNNQLTINEQERRELRQQITELREQGELLRREQQRVVELQSQLRRKEQDMETMRQQITDLRGQGERLREEQHRVTELHSHLRTNEQEMRTMRQRITDFQSQEEQLRREQQQVTALQSQLRANEQEMRRLTERRETQHHENESRPDWAINRNEIIQMKNQELGRGAWGIVVRGKFCGCDVAVKEMHENIYSSYNRHSFYREVDVASKCRHPCLLQFIGATTDEMRPLMVTEIMECNLRDRLFNSAQPPLTITEIVVISLDVARALNYLHEKKPEPIIHGDISSANVLLWRQGDQWRGKVSDYGTAFVVRQSAGTSYQGAACYSAPESLALADHRSCKIDVYSFGVFLCEMCINQHPNQKQRRKQISRMTNNVLRNLVSRCVEEEPGQRPNMQEIIAELENFGRRY